MSEAPSAAKAIAAWNTRAPSPGDAALLAALQEMMKAARGCCQRLQLTLAELAGDPAPVFEDGPAPSPLENIKALAAATQAARAALSAAQANEREGL